MSPGKKTGQLSAVPGPGEAGAKLGARQRQRIATREKIYQTAMEEFENVGFAAAQIDRIVERAGVARGTFYFHFKTKQHVLVEFQHRLQEDFLSRLSEAGEPPKDPGDFFLQIYELASERRQEQPELMREMMAMYVRSDMGMVMTEEALIVHVVDYLSEAAERGVVRRDIPPEELALHFLSAMFVHFMGAADPSRADEFARRKVEILVRGMLP